MTTIRVRSELRDELKAQARAAGLSLGDYFRNFRIGPRARIVSMRRG